MLIELVHCKKNKKKHVQTFVRLKGDREEVADLILTLNGCLLGSGQRNTQERVCSSVLHLQEQAFRGLARIPD